MNALDEAAKNRLDLVTPTPIGKFVRLGAYRDQSPSHLGCQPLKAAMEFLNPSPLHSVRSKHNHPVAGFASCGPSCSLTSRTVCLSCLPISSLLTRCIFLACGSHLNIRAGFCTMPNVPTMSLKRCPRDDKADWRTADCVRQPYAIMLIFLLDP